LTYEQQLEQTFIPDAKARQKHLSLARSIDAELERRRGIFEQHSDLAQDKPIVQAIIDLDYKGYRQASSNIRRLLERIPAIASEITERFPLEFAGVGEDERGLFPKFNTPDGVMPLHSLSQGTQSILHWIAHLLIGMANYYDFPSEPENCPGILIVDEIDAHLHPSWQRRIIATLTKHFRSLQLFCSTHSPLMLAGLKRGQIILLKRQAKGGVVYSKNASDIVSWSADEILRNLLDVASPTDVATEEKLRRLETIMEKESLSPDEKKELKALRNEVSHTLFSAAAVSDICSTTSGRGSMRKQSPARKAAVRKHFGGKRSSTK
jgi:hypothetical protein